MKAKHFFKQLFVLILILSGSFCYSQTKDSAWVSANTVAATVKLMMCGTSYIVDGLSEDYEYCEKNNGEPDFGNAKVVETFESSSTGTGIIVTKKGLLFSNAHVTDAANIKVSIYTDEEGNEICSDKGETLYEVYVPNLEKTMIVGIVDKNNLESKGDDKITYKYLAKVLLEDEDYDNQERDRAILQISNEIKFTDDINFDILDLKKTQDFPYVALSNPFVRNFNEVNVRAIGFPATGDPIRSARTSGEIMGYDSESDRSVIKHTSYISGGNSGGGLFFKDQLIGINTWDLLENTSRPVAMSQPVTYWFEYLYNLKWVFDYTNEDLPIFDVKWISDDPSNEMYKNAAYINVELKGATGDLDSEIIVYNTDFKSVDEIQQYLEDEILFQTYAEILEVDMTPKEISEQTGLDLSLVKKLKQCETYDDITKVLPVSQQKNWLKFIDDSYFCYDVFNFLSEKNLNKTLVTLQKNNKYQISLIDSQFNFSKPSILNVNSDMIQNFTYQVK